MFSVFYRLVGSGFTVLPYYSHIYHPFVLFQVDIYHYGDVNVAHEEIDLKNPKTNHFSAGFSDEERGKFTELLKAGFADTFRSLYPDTVKYSWWSYMFKSREKNVGWRIDYFVVSQRILEKVKDSFILNEIMGSDHCPVGIEIDL